MDKNREMVVEALKSDEDLRRLLIEGCMAHYDTKTGEIHYIDPYDNMCRYRLTVCMKKHPELKLRVVAIGLDSYLEADFSDKKYIPLEDLLK